MSYTIFRIMSQKTGEVGERSRAMLLDPGPDVVVADEAHLLKNEEAQVRRIMVFGSVCVRLGAYGSMFSPPFVVKLVLDLSSCNMHF